MYKLLIVDDEIAIRTSLANYFPWEEEGFVVTGVCADGREAIDFINANEVDVLLMDIMMPHINGIEVAQYIYENKLDIQVVLLSAYGEFEYAQTSMRYGVQYYILKPTKYKELQKLFCELRQKMEQKSMERDRGLTEEYDVIEKMKEYVNENYKDITLSTIAEHFHMSISYISRFFKKKTEQNFTEYLTLVRMEKARELLEHSDKMVYEVCEDVGYSDPRSFSIAFKRTFGISPNEYRRNRRK